MSRRFLWGLAAVCFFVAAGINYHTGGRTFLLVLQAAAGVLMLVLALKYGRKA